MASPDRMIFIAGHTGVDAGGAMIGGDDVEAQAEQAFRNPSTALESVGCIATNLVKPTVFVRDMSKLPDCRRARDRFLNSVNPPVAPAVTLVEVSRLYSERLLIEIAAVAAAEVPEVLIASGEAADDCGTGCKKRVTGRKSHWQEILSAVPRTTDIDPSREISQSGHFQTHAPQQDASLLDHLVGADKAGRDRLA